MYKQESLLALAFRLAIVTLFTISFINTAWVTEDAYITFRVVNNVLAGDGYW